MRYVVCPASAIPPGERKIVRPRRDQGIGVFNIDNEFYALKNVCPHQGAELCLGRVSGTTEARARDDGPPELVWARGGEIISCPWHHWEFEIKTGRTVFPSRNRVATYPATLEARLDGGDIQGVETYPVVVEGGFVVLEL
jgi:nitrite reductase/ring-hydroxylating ferredoxin subunit